MADLPQLVDTYEADGLVMLVNVNFATNAPIQTLEPGTAVECHAIPVNGGASVAAVATIFGPTQVMVAFPAWSLAQGQWEVHTRVDPPGSTYGFQTISVDLVNVRRSARPRPAS